ncbi:methyl-accepting chemotaxis protein [Halodesulfovibrio sp.]|uniref:methyl-accepting chemotaxis protein n=1 Tax=Halodesulfovibrio sp. TaxID=1912772 RepID=UPI0025CFCFD3|nr:methyl-accepting chemotaxis protein [Halodesulfovibrio sp.]MCT4533855.1 methyl-accepting chemotaxis protein [Halodesulfovibrio sp.]
MVKSNKNIIIGLLFFLTGLICYTVYTCQSTINHKMEQVDRDLLAGAMAAANIVPDSFNAQVRSGKINDAEYAKIVKKLSRYVATSKHAYAYTMTLVGNDVHYTASSATPQELREGYIQYYEKYEDTTDDLLMSLRTGKVVFETLEDSYGTFRSVSVPMNASDGTRYMAGADINLSDVEAIRQETYVTSIVTSLYFLLILSPLVFLIYRGAKGQEEFLHAEIDRNTQNIVTLNKELEERMCEVDRAAESSQQAMHDALAAKEAAESRREKVLQAAGQLNGIVGRVTKATHALSENVEDAVSGARIQLEKTAEAAIAMEEINTSVVDVAHNANNASGYAENAREGAVNGATVVNSVSESITEVDGQAEQMKLNFNELASKAEGINSIMNVISDIADQTNLLALNAAIEAARAGDAGRGFAVVADEVRKLAEKTMDATQEVGQAITDIQQASQENIAGMERVMKTVEKSTGLATSAGDSLNSIVQMIETSAEQVQHIATVSEQQAITSEQVSRRADEVKHIAEETEQNMSISAQSVTELTEMTSELKALVDDLLQDE